MDDIELSDIDCPQCGQPMATRPCPAVGCDDGWIDLSEDDPLNFTPGEMGLCWECLGQGEITWCANCGYDPVEAEPFEEEE